MTFMLYLAVPVCRIFLKNTNYEGVVGIACGEEMKVLGPLLNSMDVAGQAVPLFKNGCANTVFNIETLVKVL